MEKKNCCFPGSLCLVDSTLFYSNLAEGGGISVLDLVSGEHSVVLKGGESSSPHGLVNLKVPSFSQTQRPEKSRSYIVIQILERQKETSLLEMALPRESTDWLMWPHSVNRTRSLLKVTHALSAALAQMLFLS